MPTSPIFTQQPIPLPQPDLQRSTLPPRPIHVAIISDGNGRWATSRGLPRSAGHRAGAQTARAVIEGAPRLGIHTLTLFALSSANWQRPPSEVTGILRILHEYLLTETSHCIDEGIRISIIGRRDRVPPTRRQALIDSEAAPAPGTRPPPPLTRRFPPPHRHLHRRLPFLQSYRTLAGIIQQRSRRSPRRY